MSVAWFVDGSYLFNCWSGLHRPNENLEYLKLRKLLEARYCDTASAERITEAYYFDADPDPPPLVKMRSTIPLPFRHRLARAFA